MDRLGLSQWLQDECKKLRISRPFPIQAAVIPLILAGKALLGCAPTGQGKTAAYVLPVVQLFAEDPQLFFCLVVAPTRELADQISRKFAFFGQAAGLRTALAVGGVDLTQQKGAVEAGAHVLVGTPGRLVEHAKDPSIARSLLRLKVAVFDEVDALASGNMQPDTAEILLALPAGVQRLLFSATIARCRDAITETFGDGLLVADVSGSQSVASDVNHFRQKHDAVTKLHTLFHLLTRDELPILKDSRGFVFVQNIEEAEVVFRTLQLLGVSCAGLHSLQGYTARTASLDSMLCEKVHMIVATDLAARGLDLPHVDWVVNYSVPFDFDVYCHRVGRCARAGRDGVAVTFYSHETAQMLRNIEKALGNRMERCKTRVYDVMATCYRVNKAWTSARLTLERTSFGHRLQLREARRPKRGAKAIEGRVKAAKRAVGAEP